MRHKDVYVSHIHLTSEKSSCFPLFWKHLLLSASEVLYLSKIHPMLPKHSIKTGSNGAGIPGLSQFLTCEIPRSSKCDSYLTAIHKKLATCCNK